CLAVNMAPVIKAKRHVAVLLNLEHNDVAAQRVNRPSRQENAVAGLRSEPCEVVRYHPIRERPPQIVGSGAWLQARIDAALGPRFQHDPCFSLPGLAHRQQIRVRIPRMDLNREHFTRVEELQQQWEPAETPGQLSQHLLRELLQQLTDGSPFERSIGNVARMVIAVAKHPCFADRTITGQRCGEQVGQTAAAPEPILIDWFESQGVQKLLTQELSLLLLRTVGRPPLKRSGEMKTSVRLRAANMAAGRSDGGADPHICE